VPTQGRAKASSNFGASGREAGRAGYERAGTGARERDSAHELRTERGWSVASYRAADARGHGGGQRCGDAPRREASDLEDHRALSAYEFMKTHTFPVATTGATGGRAESCARVIVFLDGVSLGPYYLGLEGATGFGGANRSRIESNQMIIERIGHLSVEDLEGIEVYREGAFTPADLVQDACQAISIWTAR
jgi:hypothetical protein